MLTSCCTVAFKYDSEEVVDFLDRNNNGPKPISPIPSNVPKLDWSRAVDGRRCLRIYRQLPSSSGRSKWEVQSRIVGIFDKGPGKGTVMEREHTVVDSSTGLVYTRSWETAFFVRTGGWGGERGMDMLPLLAPYAELTQRHEIGPPIQRVAAPTFRKEDVNESFQTTERTAYIYRYVTFLKCCTASVHGK